MRRKFLSWLRSLRGTPPQQPAVTIPTPEPLSIERQWASVITIASGRLKGIDHSHGLQSEASRQIDAAYYALNQILDELATVMQLPEQHRSAAVVKLDPALRRIVQPSKEQKRSKAA